MEEWKEDWEKNIAQKKKLIVEIFSLLVIAAIVLGVLYVFGVFDPDAKQDASADTTISVNQENADPTTEKQSPVISTTEATVPGKTPESTAGHDNATQPTETILPNTSRETAWKLPLNQKQAEVVEGETADWYQFTTVHDLAVYRISLSSLTPPNKSSLFPFLYIGVYNDMGIKLDEFDIWCDKEFGFIDLYLEPDSQYYAKVYLGGRFAEGAYEISVSARVCDAGVDQESATQITLGTMHMATIDSTLSDWYVFQVPEDGDYTYTIHNVDVGCDIYFSKKHPTRGNEGASVKNEDNYTGRISNMKKDECVYFEIYPYNENPAANGQYIIIIEKRAP